VHGKALSRSRPHVSVDLSVYLLGVFESPYSTPHASGMPLELAPRRRFRHACLHGFARTRQSGDCSLFGRKGWRLGNVLCCGVGAAGVFACELIASMLPVPIDNRRW